MKIYLKITVLFLICTVLLCFFPSCSFDESRNNFFGGELLDDEKLSEMKENIILSESESTHIETNEQNEDSAVQTEPGNLEDNTDGEGDTDFNSIESDPLDDEESETTDLCVYWTQGGAVWHLTSKCSSLSKSKNIIKGTVDEAKEAGKERVCSFCCK